MEIPAKVLAHKTTEYLYEDAIATFKETFIDEIRQCNIDYKDHIANQPGFFSKLKNKAERKLFTSVATEGVQQTAETVGEISGYGAIVKSIGNLATTVVRASIILYYHIKDKNAAEKLKDAKKFSTQLEKIGGEKFLDEAADYLINRFFFALQEFSSKHQSDIEELSLFFTAALCNILLGNIVWNPTSSEEELYAKLIPNVNDSLFTEWLVNKKFSYQGWTIQGLLHRAPVCTPNGDMYVKGSTDARQDKYPPQRLDEAAAKKSYQLGRLNLRGQFLSRDSLLIDVVKGGKLNEWKTDCEKYHRDIVQQSKSWGNLLSNVSKVREKQRDLREESWKILTKIKDSAEPEKLILSLRKIISDYARCLWVSTYHEVITRNAVLDRVAALWFQLEVAWLALLFKEGRSYWSQNQRKLPRAKPMNEIILDMESRIKHLGILVQYVVTKAIPILQKVADEQKQVTPVAPSSSNTFKKTSKITELDDKYNEAFDLYQKGTNATTDKFAKEYFTKAVKKLDLFISKLETKKETQQDELQAEAYNLRALCYVGLGETQSALNDIKQTLKIEPRNKEALYMKIKLLELEGDNEEIINAINEFFAVCPSDPNQEDLLELMQNLSNVQSGKTM